MASDDTLATLSCNRDVPQNPPGPLQYCRDVVHIAIFFDGTGNNNEKDTATKSWSNVARMYAAAMRDERRSTYPVYVSGVGTKSNSRATGWLESASAWLQDNEVVGGGLGGGGGRRLSQGNDEVNYRLREVLIAGARQLGAETEKYAATATEKSFSEVNQTLSKHRLIKIINHSFFGFSRGAALARAYSNKVIRRSKLEGGKLLYEGYPLRLNFLGIYDTVASFGVPSKNVRLPFEERELVVSPLVERCIHYVAAHEVRAAFPVDLIRKGGKLAGPWVEKVYPGMHSDVGGGYGPTDQGIDNNFARIPLRDMMRESVVSGVRITSYDELAKTQVGLFEQRFKVRNDTLESYQHYMAACGALSGTVESQIKRHMHIFYSANGTMHRRGIVTPGERQRNASKYKYKYLGPKGMAWEISKYRMAVKTQKWVRFGNPSVNDYVQYIKPADWQISAWDQTASDGVVDFVSRYVHDSKVDFIFDIEPFSYFRPRGIQESTVNVTVEWGYWLSDKVDEGKEAVGQAYE